MDYYQKYLKYKNKYNDLKNSISITGGGKKFTSSLKGKRARDSENKMIDNFRKQFKSLIQNIKFIQAAFLPSLFLVDETGNEIIPKINNKIKEIFIKRIKSNYNDIFLNIFGLNFYDILYEEDKNYVFISLKPDFNDFEYLISNVHYTDDWEYKDQYNIHDIIYFYELFFKDIIDSGPDTWQAQNDTILIKKKEIDNNNYFFNVKYLGINFG